jgi:hypothetical protein
MLGNQQRGFVHMYVHMYIYFINFQVYVKGTMSRDFPSLGFRQATGPYPNSHDYKGFQLFFE